jgi:hypothetical protein
MNGPLINVSLFKKAGVELPKGERVTWEEWMDAAAKVKKATGVPYAAAVDRSGHRLDGFIQSYGGGFFTADGKDVRITSPETRKAIQAFVKFHGWTMPLIRRRHGLRGRQPAVRQRHRSSTSRQLAGGAVPAGHRRLVRVEGGPERLRTAWRHAGRQVHRLQEHQGPRQGGPPRGVPGQRPGHDGYEQAMFCPPART